MEGRQSKTDGRKAKRDIKKHMEKDPKYLNTTRVWFRTKHNGIRSLDDHVVDTS